MHGIDFMAAWLPMLYRFELAANLRNPELNLTYAACVPSCEWLGWPGAVTPDEREALAGALAEAWDRLPLAARVPFLMPFRDGGTRNTLEAAGGLITDFLVRTREPAIATEGWRRDQWLRVAREIRPACA
jgi:hypothetical protein